ncbi:hypothetical protein NQ315_003193, partial [Exocentrus adspersus]
NVHRIAQAIRLAKHDVTGYSPSFLVFARNIPFTGDYYGKVSENKDNLITVGNKIEDIQALPELHRKLWISIPIGVHQSNFGVYKNIVSCQNSYYVY